VEAEPSLIFETLGIDLYQFKYLFNY